MSEHRNYLIQYVLKSYVRKFITVCVTINSFILIGRFEEGPRIPGSKYIDIDDVALTPDLNPGSLPHMLPKTVSSHEEVDFKDERIQ